MADPQIRAVITADDRASRTIGLLHTKIGDLSIGAAALGVAFVKAANMTGDFLVSSIKAYTEAERSAKMLEHAVVKVTGATKEQLAQTSKLAEEISRKGVLDDDVIRQGLAQLSTFRLQNSSVQKLAKSMADLTVNQFGVKATGEQAADAANMMAKALRGEFGMLQRSGIVFTDAQKKTIQFGTESEKVSAIIAGFNENLKYTNETARQTGEGALAAMDVTMNNLQESIGQALLPSVIMLADKLREFVESDKFKAWLEKVTGWIATELPKFIEKLFNEYIPKAKQAFDEWWPKIKTVGDIIMGVINIIAFLGRGINYLSSDIGLAIGFVMLWANDAKNAIEGFGYNAYTAVSNVAKWFSEKFQDIKNFVSSALNEITSWFRSLPESIGRALVGLKDAIVKPFADAFNWVKSEAGKVKDSVAGALDPKKKHSPSLVDKIKIGVQDIKEEYTGLFSSLDSMRSNFKVADLSKPVRQIPTQQPVTSSNQNSTVNITINSTYSSGSEQEKRAFAKEILGALKDIANQKNTSVTELMGV